MSKASQLRQKAQNFLKKGKVDKAIEEYKKLLSVESRNPNLYNELGDIYLRVNDRIQAVSSFEKASSKYENVALYNNAVAVCKKILRIVPGRTETVYKLGEIKAKQKLLGEAESFFTQYFDAILADPESDKNSVQEKVENVLELVPDCEGIWSMASEVFSHIGIKSRAAEVLAHLISKNSLDGDPQRLNFYRSRLDLLKQALNRQDLERIEKIAVDTQQAEAGDASGPEDGSARTEAGPVVIETEQDDSDILDEIEEEVVVGTDGVGVESGGEDQASTVNREGIALTDYASDMSGEETAVNTDIQDEATGPEDVPVDEAPVEETADRAAPAADADDAIQEDEPVETVEYVIDGEEDDAVKPSGQDDLSALLDEEDARLESEASTKNLAEEITSDVEEDDFRSHYDLGMAYIEMGLYSDAVKELQISSKSDQLKLQSLEMVGMCFISLGNPRLAVKQLERGLEIALSSGQDSLGIHYNLGLAYEALDDDTKAREHFEEVYIVDVSFRDISAKMKRFSTVS